MFHWPQPNTAGMRRLQYSRDPDFADDMTVTVDTKWNPISTVIGDHLGKKWLTEVEPARVLGPEQDYAWEHVEGETAVRIIRDIDEAAMKKDFFNTLNGQATRLFEAGE